MFKGSAAGGSKAVGNETGSRALAWLRARGLTLVECNYRVARLACAPRRGRPHPARP